MRNKNLDGLRFLTAFYVVLHHCLDMYLPDVTWTMPLRLGQVAVLIFFVLSGYFMHFSVKKKSHLGFVNFIKHRLLRLYPIYIVAILLPLILVMSFNTWSSLSVPLSAKNILGNIFFLQDLGRYPNVIFTTWYNAPLWSLSYEMYFYIAHFMLSKLRNKNIYEIFIIISFLAYMIYPNKLAINGIYFIYYYIGILLATNEIKRAKLITGILPIIGALMIIKISGYNKNYLILHWVLTPVLLMIFLLTRRLFTFNWLRFFSSGARISYGLYAFHFPLMVNLPELLNMNPSIFLFVIGTILTVILAWILEVILHKKLTFYFK